VSPRLPAKGDHPNTSYFLKVIAGKKTYLSVPVQNTSFYLPTCFGDTYRVGTWRGFLANSWRIRGIQIRDRGITCVSVC